jgi:hypothetical protein
MGAKIEIFADGSPISDGFIKQVRDLACSKCEVIIYNLNERMVAGDCEDKAKANGIEAYPAVTINGKLVEIEKLKSVKLVSDQL